MTVYGGSGSGGAMQLDKLVLQLIKESKQCEQLDMPRIEIFAVSDVQKLSNEFVKTIYSHTIVIVIIVIVIITLPLGLSAFEQRGCESSHSKYPLGLNPLKTTMTFRPECHGFHKSE